MLEHDLDQCHHEFRIGMKFDFNTRRGFTALLKPVVNSQSRTQSIYDHSFSMMGAKMWNILPLEINTVTSSLDHFKVILGKFLQLFPDQPPIEGYSRANNNSLLEWWQSLSVDPVFTRNVEKLFTS